MSGEQEELYIGCEIVEPIGNGERCLHVAKLNKCVELVALRGNVLWKKGVYVCLSLEEVVQCQSDVGDGLDQARPDETL